jgi:F-type H+-transporting ATPase subunit delta
MSSVSSESLAAVRSALEQTAGTLSLDSAREFFGVLNVIDSNAGLQRALTDPARESSERAALAARIFGGQVSDQVLSLVEAVAQARWSSTSDFVDTFETLGVDAAALVAERDGEAGIARLENDLFAFVNTVAHNHELSAALGLVTADEDARKTLAQNLSRSASEPAKILLEQAITHPRGLKVVTLVERFSQFVAARHNLWIAHVESSQELTPEQSQRLATALQRMYGRELKINATTLPSLIGGVRITVGNEVVDSSTLGRVNHLKQRLAS